MPELPEVENVKNTLAPHVVGKKINNVEVYIERLVKHPIVENFVAELKSLTIKDLKRRGKYLLFELSKDKLMVIHLRMTGALIYTDDAEPPKYSRIKFQLNKGNLWYTDVRTLGTIHLLNKGENIIKGLANLGPEPLENDLTLSYLKKALKEKNTSIKGALLDQSIIAGLGNIYVDEALFLASLLPTKKASDVKGKQLEKLYQSIINVIAQGIKNRGTSFRDYKDGEGKKGENQEHLKAYGRKEQPCYTCGTSIKYAKVAGRGTCYCPKCQK